MSQGDILKLLDEVTGHISNELNDILSALDKEYNDPLAYLMNLFTHNRNKLQELIDYLNSKEKELFGSKREVIEHPEPEKLVSEVMDYIQETGITDLRILKEKFHADYITLLKIIRMLTDM